ncbi:MAG: transglutaminase domain-containing protein [Bacteroidaceae bacterium]|nr:transglutaminase domain-containing protein [Bacteroidaceae bacterium]
MKRITNILILSFLAMFVNAQEKNDIMRISFVNGDVVTFDVTEIDNITFELANTEEEEGEETPPSFPEGDGSPKLDTSNPQKTASNLLLSAGIACTDTMGRVVITDAQYQEIKTFTDNLVNGSTNQKNIYDKCFAWITSNIKYGTEYDDGSYVNNDPYPVFTKKKAVCQGYANLLFVMLHTQNVPALVTNGYLNGYGVFGGHAWNYVNCDGKWYVSDPTNGGKFDMSNTSSYSHLIPTSFDVILFEKDGCQFDYNESHLNICSVATKSKYFVTPYSVGGYQVTSFNPTSDLPANVRELYIGKNIETFGNERIGLNYHGANVEYIHVDPQHPRWRSNKGIVYDHYSDYPLYIPLAMKVVELLPMETIGKNTVYNHNSVEVVAVAKGTKKIEAWAFENCPNLMVAYIPEGVEIAKDAFTGVHPNFIVLRKEYPGSSK